MRLFGGGRAADAELPVRRDRVMALLQAHMAESDAHPDNCAAETDALGRLAKESTPAEYGGGCRGREEERVLTRFRETEIRLLPDGFRPSELRTWVRNCRLRAARVKAVLGIS